MSNIALVLYIVLGVATPVLLIKFLLLPMASSVSKKVMVAVTILVAAVFEILFISSAFIPDSIDGFMGNGIANMENRIDEIYPGYVHKELGTEDFKSIIADSRKLREYVEADKEVGFIVKTIGLNTYISYIEDFGDNVDGYLQEFEASGTPFTMHNILSFLHLRLKTPVLQATRIIQIVILAIFGVAVIAIAAASFAIRKGLLEPSGKSVTFGEGAV